MTTNFANTIICRGSFALDDDEMGVSFYGTDVTPDLGAYVDTYKGHDMLPDDHTLNGSDYAVFMTAMGATEQLVAWHKNDQWHVNSGPFTKMRVEFNTYYRALSKATPGRKKH